MITNGDV